MGTYIDKQGMIDRFGESELIALTDRDSAGTIDDAVLDAAIADAEARIDAKLRGRYTLPFATAPDELAPLAADIARYLMWGIQAPDAVKARMDFAMGELRDYATGRNTLDVPGEDPDTSPQAPTVIAPAGVFTDATLGMMP